LHHNYPNQVGGKSGEKPDNHMSHAVQFAKANRLLEKQEASAVKPVNYLVALGYNNDGGPIPAYLFATKSEAPAEEPLNYILASGYRDPLGSVTTPLSSPLPRDRDLVLYVKSSSYDIYAAWKSVEPEAKAIIAPTLRRH
jgi:hypothetical protein